MMNGMGLYGFGGMGIGWIFWLIILGLVIWEIFTILNNKNMHNSRYLKTEENPSDILKRRYARGEIASEQFRRIKEDIKTS